MLVVDQEKGARRTIREEDQWQQKFARKNFTQIFVALRFSLAQLSRRSCRQVSSNNHKNNNKNNNARCLPKAQGVKTETKTNTGQIPNVHGIHVHMYVCMCIVCMCVCIFNAA